MLGFNKLLNLISFKNVEYLNQITVCLNSVNDKDA